MARDNKNDLTENHEKVAKRKKKLCNKYCIIVVEVHINIYLKNTFFDILYYYAVYGQNASFILPQ